LVEKYSLHLVPDGTENANLANADFQFNPRFALITNH